VWVQMAGSLLSDATSSLMPQVTLLSFMLRTLPAHLQEGIFLRESRVVVASMDVAHIAQVSNLDREHVQRVCAKLNHDREAITLALDQFFSGTGAFVEGKQEDGWVERRKEKPKKVTLLRCGCHFMSLWERMHAHSCFHLSCLFTMCPNDYRLMMIHVCQKMKRLSLVADLAEVRAKALARVIPVCSKVTEGAARVMGVAKAAAVNRRTLRLHAQSVPVRKMLLQRRLLRKLQFQMALRCMSELVVGTPQQRL
jgi:hypothetical protein